MNRLAWLVVVAACSSAAPRSEPAKPTANMIDPNASLAITSEEITFAHGTNTVPGTLVRPVQAGRWTTVVLMAGSGPTDRDWNSPLLPGKNGSAKLLAEELAKRGAIVLRFDKAGVGGNKTSLENVTFDIYRDEAQAALAFLRARPDVAAEKLFVAGHSEGGMHAMRVAVAEGDRIAGLVLLSTSGRSMKNLLLAQVEPQLRTALPAAADAELAKLRGAFDDFLAGKAVDPKQVTSIQGLQMLVASIVNPGTASLVRSMLGFDPIATVAEVRVPVLVYNGGKDVQVDPDVDARRLVAARAGKPVDLVVATDADHTLKLEIRTLPELRADLAMVQMNMNADDRVIDPKTATALASWLAAH